MPRKAKDGKQKSDKELEAEYIVKVEHAVERIGNWCDKLVKLARSRKAYLTTDDKQNILGALEPALEGVSMALNESEPSKGAGTFKLR